MQPHAATCETWSTWSTRLPSICGGSQQAARTPLREGVQQRVFNRATSFRLRRSIMWPAALLHCGLCHMSNCVSLRVVEPPAPSTWCPLGYTVSPQHPAPPGHASRFPSACSRLRANGRVVHRCPPRHTHASQCSVGAHHCRVASLAWIALHQRSLLHVTAGRQPRPGEAITSVK